jgi:hypothetical protein
VFTESLPSNDRKDIHTDTLTDEKGFMKDAVEMGSGAMIYTPSYMKIGSGIQKLTGGHRHTDTHIAW